MIETQLLRIAWNSFDSTTNASEEKFTETVDTGIPVDEYAALTDEEKSEIHRRVSEKWVMENHDHLWGDD